MTKLEVGVVRVHGNNNEIIEVPASMVTYCPMGAAGGVGLIVNTVRATHPSLKGRVKKIGSSDFQSGVREE